MACLGSQTCGWQQLSVPYLWFQVQHHSSCMQVPTSPCHVQAVLQPLLHQHQRCTLATHRDCKRMCNSCQCACPMHQQLQRSSHVTSCALSVHSCLSEARVRQAAAHICIAMLPTTWPARQGSCKAGCTGQQTSGQGITQAAGSAYAASVAAADAITPITCCCVLPPPLPPWLLAACATCVC